ncbi:MULTISPECIES: hypothetical protein [Gammaproteobacteria]|jgi:hypothetical protein|uniref:Uncharacterized protein n=1 Tax=Pseudomonas lini TaxID=163011 RepID=A0A423I7X9_9PSED|nr:MULTISPECIES: hypothetical protein [Gammaproteobacteria]MBK5301881.1 hypothetical protein [Bacillus sp. TH86]MBK5321650.1 hypothetical protein [Bacillus sp. TH59]MBK5336600.1 hypothetical protein [Bacillus sp. TH57]MBK5310665.1 hypothetical protein [Pseudomonas sp. TH71]MBK5316147.1 hypothetical protein [Erwinia sp. TH79]
MVFRVGNLTGVLEVSAKGQIPDLQLGQDRNGLQTAIVFVAKPVQEPYAELIKGSKRYFLENRGITSINPDDQSVDESVGIIERLQGAGVLGRSQIDEAVTRIRRRLKLEAVAFYGATAQAITHEDCF